ncbi:single-stranded DNA-binding protein [Lysinibacillus sp. KU-BSD001]|uniref:single-stranded DNA-binding protein n=1 Tax=Lysinibacillus sp. KU-BSD001 TaxID=3141328 RepID=UPI0036EAFC6D
MNHSILTGRLTKPAEISYLQDGKAKAVFTLAVNRPFTNAQGEREADFIRCTAWGKTAENVANYTTKGSKIGVQGRIQTGSYETQQGQKVYTTDIVVNEVEFLESKQTNQNGQQPQNVQQAPVAQPQYQMAPQQAMYQQQPVQQQYVQQGNPIQQQQPANAQYAVNQDLPF